MAVGVVKPEESYQPSRTLISNSPKFFVDVYLVGNPLVFKGLEELALLQGREQALLVAELEENVAPVANEGRPARHFQHGCVCELEEVCGKVSEMNSISSSFSQGERYHHVDHTCLELHT